MMSIKVLNEIDTFKAVRDAHLNLSRFGDGEFKLALGRSIKCQQGSSDIQTYLLKILKNLLAGTLTAIPNIYDVHYFSKMTEAKQIFWKKYTRTYILDLLDKKRVYGSSFVSRKDSARWMTCDDLWAWRTLWEDKRVLSVVGNVKWKTDIIDNTSFKMVLECPAQNAFTQFFSILSEIISQVRSNKIDIVILHLGPTATILANALAYFHIWALDLGSWQFNFSCECTKQGYVPK